MDSSLDSSGFALLNNWNAQHASIRFSFVGIGKRLQFSADCVIAELRESELRLVGAGFSLFLDLTDATFEEVGSRETFAEMGLEPSQYPESATIILGNGDTVNLVVPLPERESSSN